MKRFAKNSSQLSLVPPAGEPADSCTEERSVALKESFDGWLSSIAPKLLVSSPSTAKPKKAYQSRRPMSSTDIVRVKRATVRESNAHRHWPQDVVISFLAADVIKRNKR